ncbi:MAG: hypothetical protein KDD61_05735 [Bdellovibrionales bacterium]|nr:hypothetical protein [Bdellovibrionales bacterium]
MSLSKHGIFTFTTLFFQLTTHGECRNYRPMQTDCTFYRSCLESQYQCGQEGYPLGYGEKYCQRFHSLNTPQSFNDKRLSTKGVKWRNRTLVCLQDELIREQFQKGFLNCENIKNVGFQTHARCYAKADPSICGLPLSDWKAIASIVDIKDYGKPESVKQILEVIVACGERTIEELLAFEHERAQLFEIYGLKTQAFKAAHISYFGAHPVPPQIPQLDEKIRENKQKLKFIESIKERGHQ